MRQNSPINNSGGGAASDSTFIAIKSRFIAACKDNDLQTAATILQDNQDRVRELANSLVEIADAYEEDELVEVSLLFLAAQSGHANIVNLLINNGADVNFTASDTHSTPLHMAAKRGCTEIIDMLLNAGADPTAVNTRFEIPLFEAVYNGHLDAVNKLVTLCPDLNIRTLNASKITLLNKAIRGGHLDVVNRLLELGSDPYIRCGLDITPLHEAAKGGNLDIVIRLLELGLDPNVKNFGGSTTLHTAAGEDNINVVDKLITSGADPNAKDDDDKTPLYYAAFNGNLSAVNCLLVRGADPSAKGYDGTTTLHYAAWGGNLDVVNRLLELGLDPNARNLYGSTPLHHAAAKGDINIVDKLLTLGADPNAKDSDGKTPLCYAAAEGYLDVVNALIKTGMDVNQTTYYDETYFETPLYSAAEWGHLNIVDRLLAAGANPNLVPTHYGNPLGVANYNGYFNIVDRLLAAGADPNLAQTDDRISLMTIIADGGLVIASTLLAYGARPPQLDGQFQPLPDDFLQLLTNPAAIFNTQRIYPDKIAIIGTEEGRRKLEDLRGLVGVDPNTEIPELKPYQPGADYEAYAILSAQHAYLQARGQGLDAEVVALATYFKLMNHQEVIGADLTYEILNHQAIENFRSAFSSSAADLTCNAEDFMADSTINDGNSELDFSIDVDDLFPDADHFNDTAFIDDIDTTLTTNEDDSSMTRRMASIRDVITILQQGRANYEGTGILDIPPELLDKIVYSYAKIAPRQEGCIRQNEAIMTSVNSSLAANFAPESVEIISNAVRKALEDRLQLTQTTISREAQSIANKVYEEKKRKEKTQKIIQEGTTETAMTPATRPEEESAMQPAMKSIAGTVQAAVAAAAADIANSAIYIGGGGGVAKGGARAVTTTFSTTSSASATIEPGGGIATYPTTSTSSTSSSTTSSIETTGKATTSPATSSAAPITMDSQSISTTPQSP